MKFINFNSVILFVLLLVATSCNDFLVEKDPSNFTKENYFTLPAHAESAVNSIYDALKSTTGGGFNGAPWMMLEFATGLANTELGQAQNSIFVRNLTNNADNGYGVTYWQSTYKGIGNANLAIQQIPNIKMDEIAKNKYMGEAYFLRAWYYYNLARIFGHIPLIIETVDLSSEQLNPNQADLDQVYAQIVSDLKNAELMGLPWTDKSGRVTMGAIKSLLADVYLTMAGYPLKKGDEYYKLAAGKAKEVIDSQQFSLFTSYDDLHDPSKKNSGENIFMVQFAAYLQPSGWQGSIIPYNQGISAYSDETGAIFANKEFVESYDVGDKRVAEKGFYFKTFTLSSDRSKPVDLGGYYIYKHFDSIAQLSTTSSGLNWPLIRYADVLLIFAEASNYVNGPTDDAYKAINAIRNRAQIPLLGGLDKSQFTKSVMKERVFEMSFENRTWYDMVRWRKAYNVSNRGFDDYVGHKFSYGPTLSERELLFPIPTSEIRNNKNLKQNIGY